MLVDPSGKIVWRGHPGNLDADTIASAVEGALPLPVWEWPDLAKGVRRALVKREFAKAIAEAEELGEDGAEILKVLRDAVASRAAAVKRAYESGDFRAFDTLARAAVDDLSGLPEADEIKALHKEFKGDKRAQEIFKGQVKVAKLMEGRIKSRDVPKIEKKLRRILEDLPETAAARDATSAPDELRQMRD